MNTAAQLVDAIKNLVDANFWTGYWDNERNNLCKKPFNYFSYLDNEYLYRTEKESRKNVENRAVQRNMIEKLFADHFK